MLEIATYETKSIQLQPGDKVVLFSDGLSEAENLNGEFFDKNGLGELLRSSAGLSCIDLHGKLMHGVGEFTGGAELSDDITMLVLEYQP